jgi:hypothetical protein
MKTSDILTTLPPDRDHLTKSHHAGRMAFVRVGVFHFLPVTFVP